VPERGPCTQNNCVHLGAAVERLAGDSAAEGRSAPAPLWGWKLANVCVSPPAIRVLQCRGCIIRSKRPSWPIFRLKAGPSVWRWHHRQEGISLAIQTTASLQASPGRRLANYGINLLDLITSPSLDLSKDLITT